MTSVLADLKGKLLDPEGRTTLLWSLRMRYLGARETGGISPKRAPLPGLEPEMEAVCQVLEGDLAYLFELEGAISEELAHALALYILNLNPLLNRIQEAAVGFIGFYVPSVSAHAGPSLHVIQAGYPHWGRMFTIEQMRLSVPSLYAAWEAEARAPVPVAPAAKCRLSDLI